MTTNDGCGREVEFNLALGNPFFSYTSPSFEEAGEIPSRETVTFTDESEGEFSDLNGILVIIQSQVINVSATSSGVTQVTTFMVIQEPTIQH